LISAALIGISGFGATHYRDLVRQVEWGALRLRAATVVNPAQEASKLAHLRHLGCTVFERYEAMLDAYRGRLDLCCIPTGIPEHAAMTIAALRAGANVFVEKPAAGAIQDVRAMQQAERAADRFVAVGFQRMYDPFTHALERSLLSGEIGELRSIGCWALWPQLDSYYSRNDWAGRLRVGDSWVLDSPFHNALAHYLMLMLFLAGPQKGRAAELEEIEAELHRARDIESADTACLRISTSTGVSLRLHLTHCSDATAGPELLFQGTRGRICWTQGDGVEKAVVQPASGPSRELISMDHEDEIRTLIMQNLRARIAGEAAFICSLELAAPEVACACGAHESSAIRTIPHRYVSRCPADDSMRTVVAGVDEAVRRGFAEGRLFSELGVPWARPGRPVSLRGYERFPRLPPTREA
jgi:predicted dehydrogenase